MYMSVVSFQWAYPRHAFLYHACPHHVARHSQGEYNVHNGHVDAAGRFKKAELLHENFVVVTNADHMAKEGKPVLVTRPSLFSMV